MKNHFLSALTITLSLFFGAAQFSWADERDWLYFPMYPRDTSHAVHLSQLQFRADGLLQSATRYPRHPDEPWTEDESRLGWYNYSTNLIDCETGFYVTTSRSLLSQNGQAIAARDVGYADWLSSLTHQLRENSEHRWPVRNEIFLACAGASHPTLKSRRTTQAKKTPARISDTPITETLKADTDALFQLTQMNLDFSRLMRRPPATASAVFDQLRQQYVAWRKAINRPYSVRADNADFRAKIQSEVSEQLHKMGAIPDGFRMLGGSIIEYERSWSPPWSAKPPRHAAHATETMRADCASGIEIPLARHWRNDDNKILVKSTVTVSALWVLLKEQYGADIASSPAQLDTMNHSAALSAVCTMIVQAMTKPAVVSDASLDTKVQAEDSEDGSYNLLLNALATENTAAAMLIKIRDAHRALVPW